MPRVRFFRFRGAAEGTRRSLIGLQNGIGRYIRCREDGPPLRLRGRIVSSCLSADSRMFRIPAALPSPLLRARSTASSTRLFPYVLVRSRTSMNSFIPRFSPCRSRNRSRREFGAAPCLFPFRKGRASRKAPSRSRRSSGSVMVASRAEWLNILP